MFFVAVSTNPSSEGRKFAVAFMKNRYPRDLSHTERNAYFIVATNDPGVVNFTVTSRFSGLNVTTHQVRKDQPVQISYPAYSVYVRATSETDKAIFVEAEEGKTISVYVVSDEHTSSDGFVALPCDGMAVTSFNRYEYIIFSTLQGTTNVMPQWDSQLIVVVCEDNTKVTVRPSTQLSGGGVFFNNHFGPGLNKAQSAWGGTNRNAGETLLVSVPSADLTGTLVSSDKPVVVIAGHECGQVPSSVMSCDHMAAQIPPHTTWGYTYLLSPLAYRQSGDFYRFATVSDNTSVIITCVDAGSSVPMQVLNITIHREQLTNWGEFQTHSNSCDRPFVPKYCCLQATKPVLVVQYSYGHRADACRHGMVGDPFMSIIPPVVQYLNSYILALIDILSGPVLERYVSVSVHVEFFHSNHIIFDDAPLESNSTAWHTIYCADGKICGYAISKPLDNRTHHIYHADENATIFVHSYGFLAKKSYGIIGGMELQPIAGK